MAESALRPPLILDEVQCAPTHTRPLKYTMDADRETNARCLLTGLQTVVLLDAVSATLTGPVSIVELHSPSLREIEAGMSVGAPTRRQNAQPTSINFSVTERILLTRRVLRQDGVMETIVRALNQDLTTDLRRFPDLIHVLTGPRQVGKTTTALQVQADWPGPSLFAAADELAAPGPDWIQAQWNLARTRVRPGGDPVLLVLDEVQKIDGWSEQVKGLWDQDRRQRTAVVPLILGSSALLLAKGVDESLAGRFLRRPCMHWGFTECRAAFGFTLDQWILFGGYPGAARFLDIDEGTWRRSIRDALIEPVLGRDILAMRRVAKPALLRHLFGLACRYPAQELSLNKMLGQLHDAGNVTTLADYLHLFEETWLISGLHRFTGSEVRRRASSPKLITWNNALVTALDPRGSHEIRADAASWGRWVENAIGAHLLNALLGAPGGDNISLLWWRDGNDEVDFVVERGGDLAAVEVKSGRPRPLGGMGAFRKKYPAARPVLVGTGGLPLEAFFEMGAAEMTRIFFG